MGVQSLFTLATDGFGIVRKKGLSIPVRALFYYVDGETIANQVIQFILDNLHLIDSCELNS